MEYKKDTLINVKKIENAIKGTNKVVMINGKFGRGKTTAVDLAINELRFRFFTDIINELKSYQNHANNKKDFEKEIIEKLLEKIQDLLEESSTEYEKLDDINEKKELLNNKDWIIKDLKKIVTSSFKEIECNNSKVNFDCKSLKKYERKTIKFFKTKLSNLEKEIEENHKKTIKFDVGGEIGNDNYLFFLYDELIVNKKKHIFKFTILMMIIFLIYKLPLFNINIISDIPGPEFINQIIDYLNNHIHNVSIPNILMFFYILWYLCNYASVLKFMIMKKLGLESSNVFIKKQIESKLKNCKFIILDDMDRVYDKNTMYEVMKLISYLHTLINEKKINATLILIGNKDMIN